MPSDYRAIRRENERRYGTEVREYGGKLLPHRYGDRTHFIYELLQNAEDALAGRGSRSGERSVLFRLLPGELRFRHCGRPFDEADVRSICGIGESTKDPGLTDIGRFGIGFKSVHAFTDRPEVHSGDEDFVIENYVLPSAAPPRAPRAADETVFVFPLREPDDGGILQEAVRRLAPRALLFLREIEIIEWSVDGGPTGLYLREEEQLDGGVRRVTLSGEAERQRETEQVWLVFARPAPGARAPGERNVEVAFRLRDGRLDPVPESDTPLFSFFPTTLRTGLSFRIQGPFRTTLARDNLPAEDPWNASLMAALADLLREALGWLRDHELLDLAAFDCLPLRSAQVPPGSLFAPLRLAVVEALRADRLLPRHGGGRVRGRDARLASPGWLRELLDGEQLGSLFGEGGEAGWLSEEISRGRTPALCQLLLDEAGVRTVRPDAVLSRLDTAFLEAQTDDWIRCLYETLARHGGARARLGRVPLIRLRDGAHVRPGGPETPAAFLPGPVETAAPTVRASVTASPVARKFLEGLGLSPPDPVDEVIRTVLPRYRAGAPRPPPGEHARDLRALFDAHRAGSRAARRRLENEVRAARVLPVVDLGSGRSALATPEKACLATGPQRALFRGVTGVRVVDPACGALEDPGATDLLVAAGVRRLLQPAPEESPLGAADRRGVLAGCEAAPPDAGVVRIEDWGLVGLEPLLAAVARLPAVEQRCRASRLAHELDGIRELRDPAIRSGKYEWQSDDGPPRPVEIPAAWIRRLNRSPWAPDVRSRLTIQGLEPASAREEQGLEPAAAELLRRRGVTTVAAVQELLARPSAASPRRAGPPSPPARSAEARVQALPDAGGGPEPHAGERRRRLDLENKAIEHILAEEPEWIRAPQENPGFDLFQRDAAGPTVRWCEVKALGGALEDFPAVLSAAQVRFALKHGEAYWLYIVENLRGPRPCILRIRDPIGRTGPLAFGPEWRALADPAP